MGILKEEPISGFEAGAKAANRRRRRSRSEKRRRSVLSGRALGRTIAAVMVLILIGYTAIIVSRVRTVAKAYGSVTIGMDQRQVRYVLGQPSAGDGGPLWKYDDNGMRL
ncbi:MAG: hypothetical protein JF593_10040, partial [Novosphingobium sp.]|nr:hypothetical protein [Novosphingobium sp.]